MVDLLKYILDCFFLSLSKLKIVFLAGPNSFETISYQACFQVAYVVVTMADSPRPGVWALEKSMDNGTTSYFVVDAIFHPLIVICQKMSSSVITLVVSP